MTDNEVLDSMSDAWAARHGLRRDASYSGETSLHPLFTATSQTRVRAASEAHFGDHLLDHSRAFKATGALRNSVLVSAPFERPLLRNVGNPGRIVEEIWALADELELRVRIGNSNDHIYEGAGSPPPALLPIVWWDPARISLPYAPLS